MTRFHRHIHRVFVLLAATMLAPAGAIAQLAGAAPGPSPVAPGNLSRPSFDTSTPVYDLGHVAAKAEGTIVAEVDGRAITLGDVSDMIATLPSPMRSMPYETLFPLVLGKLVGQQALVVRGHEAGVDAEPAVRRAIRHASDTIIANAYLDQQLRKAVTEKDLLARYDREIAGKPGPDQVHLWLIMLPTEAAAQAAIAQLKGGADFATLARKISEDSSAGSGGDLGYATRDMLTPEIGAATFELASGQVSPYPVQAGGAWYVLKVEDRVPAPTPTFAQARPALLQEAMREMVDTVTAKARAASAIHVYDINGKQGLPANSNH